MDGAGRRRRGLPGGGGDRWVPQPAAVPGVPRRDGGDAGRLVPHRPQAGALVRAPAAPRARRGRRRHHQGTRCRRRPDRGGQCRHLPAVRTERGAVLRRQRTGAAAQPVAARAARRAGRRARARAPPRRRGGDARPALVRAPGVRPRGGARPHWQGVGRRPRRRCGRGAAPLVRTGRRRWSTRPGHRARPCSFGSSTTTCSTWCCPNAHNVVVAPVAVDGEDLGIAVAEWGGGADARIPTSTVQALAQAAMHTALALRNARLLDEIERLATRDSLTGLANRRLFDESLRREAARSQRLGYAVEPPRARRRPLQAGERQLRPPDR